MFTRLLQFVHRGPVPVPVAGHDDPAIHPDGLVYPGQVITHPENPDPSVFVDVTPAPPAEAAVDAPPVDAPVVPVEAPVAVPVEQPAPEAPPVPAEAVDAPAEAPVEPPAQV